MDSEPRSPSTQPDEAGHSPYERPAVAWEEDFLPYVFSACGKMPSQGGKCSTSKNS